MEKLSLFNSLQTMLIPEDNVIGYDIVCLFVFLALQPIVVFSQPCSGL